MRSPPRTSHPEVNFCCRTPPPSPSTKTLDTTGEQAITVQAAELQVLSRVSRLAGQMQWTPWSTWRCNIPAGGMWFGTCPPLQGPITPGQVIQYPYAASFEYYLAGPSLFQQQKTLKTIKSIPTSLFSFLHPIDKRHYKGNILRSQETGS